MFMISFVLKLKFRSFLNKPDVDRKKYLVLEAHQNLIQPKNFIFWNICHTSNSYCMFLYFCLHRQLKRSSVICVIFLWWCHFCPVVSKMVLCIFLLSSKQVVSALVAFIWTKQMYRMVQAAKSMLSLLDIYFRGGTRLKN